MNIRTQTQTQTQAHLMSAVASAPATAGVHAGAEKVTSNPLERCITTACQRIAPTWPLDQLIAVNPYWGFVDQPITTAAAQLAGLCGTPLVMPKAFYREQLQTGQLSPAHLQGAIDAAQATCTVQELLAGLQTQAAHPPEHKPEHQPVQTLVTTLADSQRDLTRTVAWVDFVTHQISQHCAGYFDTSQASWNPERTGLYASWVAQAGRDHSAALLMGYSNFGKNAVALPRDARELITAATRALGLQEPEQGHRQDDLFATHCSNYYTALLMSINGWAAWCAYERWQARLGTVPDQTDDDKIVELLAIRLAWEWLLYQHQTEPHHLATTTTTATTAQFAIKWIANNRHTSCRSALFDAQSKPSWLYQYGLELAYQLPLCQGLIQAQTGGVCPKPGLIPAASAPAGQPAVQAVFCIDVRSEVLRRALEASNSAVHTRGFAGFFGLPIAYLPTGTCLTRPQLPALLAPSRHAVDGCDSPSLGQAIAQRRKRRLQWRQTWQEFRSAASSGFTFVECYGLLYAGQLIKHTLASGTTPLTVGQTGLSNADVQMLRPGLKNLHDTDAHTELQSRCVMAAGVLTAMGLRQDFARLVLFAGHGSQTANNPHAAGLDCGACGGQAGDVNARALAALLNDPDVRAGLLTSGIAVPANTWFLAGLHNTTTDDVTLYDTDLLPASHAANLQRLRADLLQASQRTRAERAPSLGLAHLAQHADSLEHKLKARANDWAQVRPEWGLVNNAAFIAAPRTRSQHLDLAGRVFLHDYDHAQDPQLNVLESIMTAPMVVANWINMQYYASVVDNPRYGSGNKVLHNVVGGRLGVFEGNGGDLRIGLPIESLHDGNNWRHTPLRLSVFIQAPRPAIDAVLAKHLVVRRLVVNQWLHLFQIDSAQEQAAVYRYTNTDAVWQAVV